VKQLLVITLLFAAPGCKRDAPPAGPPPPPVAGPKVALPDGGMRHTQRLAWVSWSSDAIFQACGRRTPDLATQGKLGECSSVPARGPKGIEHSVVAPLAHDASAPDAAPGGCRVLFDDAPGDPAAPPARATLIGPTARLPLDEWRPAREVDGDYFAVETSYSPDGKWLGIVHTSVGLGDGDQLIEVKSIEVRPAPPCK
jgi:hypothetical protein